MPEQETRRINFYWFTKDEIFQIWNYISSQPTYANEPFRDVCYKIMLQAQVNMQATIAKERSRDPQAFPFSAGEVYIPAELYEAICIRFGLRELTESQLLRTQEVSAYVLGILPTRQNE